MLNKINYFKLSVISFFILLAWFYAQDTVKIPRHKDEIEIVALNCTCPEWTCIDGKNILKEKLLEKGFSKDSVIFYEFFGTGLKIDSLNNYDTYSSYYIKFEVEGLRWNYDPDTPLSPVLNVKSWRSPFILQAGIGDYLLGAFFSILVVSLTISVAQKLFSITYKQRK